MEVLDRLPPPHRCGNELPKCRLGFFKKNPLCVDGQKVKCSCGRVYVWAHWGYSDTWGWRDLYDYV